MKEPVLFKESEFPSGAHPSVSEDVPESGKRFSFVEVNGGASFLEYRFRAARDSVLEVVVLQDVPMNQDVFIRIHADAESGATLRLTLVQKGASRGQIDLLASAKGTGASIEIQALHHSKDSQKHALRADVHHPVPGTRSDLQVWCAADGTSRSIFNGLIRIDRGASKTEAFQKNRNLLLSERAVIDSFPKLLIANDDVKCAHGSSTSSLDPDQAYYLQSRGLNHADAEAMITRGFLRQALESISDEACRATLQSRLGVLEEEWA